MMLPTISKKNIEHLFLADHFDGILQVGALLRRPVHRGKAAAADRQLDGVVLTAKGTTFAMPFVCGYNTL